MNSKAQKIKSYRPNDPDTNGFVVQREYSIFGGQALSGFSMADPPSSVIPKKHKVSPPLSPVPGKCSNVSSHLIENMGQIKDRTEPGYLELQAILKEFVKPE